MRHARQRKATHSRAIAAGSVLVLAGSLGASAAYAAPEDVAQVVQVEAVLAPDGLPTLSLPSGDAGVDLVVSEVFVEAGEGVEPGAVLLTVEEETEIGPVTAAVTAPIAGEVTLEVEVGDVVHAGEELGVLVVELPGEAPVGRLAAAPLVAEPIAEPSTVEPSTVEPAAEEPAAEESPAVETPVVEAPADESPDAIDDREPLIEPARPAFEVETQQVPATETLPSEGDLLVESDLGGISLLRAGPEETSSRYISWDVRDHNGELVGGAVFNTQGPRAGSNWGNTSSVTDCEAGPCTGADIDPDPGEFQVLRSGGLTLSATGRYQVQPTSPPAGRTFTSTAWVQQPGSNNTPTPNNWSTWSAGTFRLVAPAAPAGQTTLTVTKGGDRQADGTVGGLAGVTFYAISGVAGTVPAGDPTSEWSCVTNGSGKCSITVPNLTGRNNGYWIVEGALPAAIDAQWSRIGSLGVGGYENSKTVTAYRFFTGPVSGVSSVKQIPAEAVTTGNRGNGATWANMRENPAFPQKCGVSIAMVVDRSTSIDSTEMRAFREALQMFVGPDGLGGTPSSAAVYTFSTTAAQVGASQPMGSSALATNINSATSGSGSGYTNWDAALRLVAEASQPYDMVLFLTDGDPTTYGPAGSGQSTTVTFQPIAEAVHSANRLKAMGTAVVSVGVGLSTNSNLNLQAITGPDQGSDYFLATDFQALRNELKAIATKNCGGTISIQKQAVTSTGAAIVPNPTESNGVQFTLSSPTPGLALTPSVTTTTAPAGNGWATASYTLPTGVTTASITITETDSARFDFKNAVCTVNGQAVGVQDDDSYTFPAGPGAIVSCTFRNELLPTVEVAKDWVINGVIYSDTATLPSDSLIGTRTAELTLRHAGIQVPGAQFGAAQVVSAVTPVTVGEGAITLPPGCSLTTSYSSQTPGVAINASTGVSSTLKNGANEFTVTNTVSCATLTLIKVVENQHGGTSVVDDWTLTAAGTGATPGVTGRTGEPAVTNRLVIPGAYDLTESGPAGWQNQYAGTWTCGAAGMPTATRVTVPAATQVTCTVTNRDRAATLTLTKIVDNGSTGATTNPSEWTLTAAPQSPISGQPTIGGAANATTGVAANAAAAKPGRYLLSETSSTVPSGAYEASAWTCSGGVVTPISGSSNAYVDVPVGTSVSCQITNTALTPTLTLVKQVVNDHGGTSNPTHWTLTASPVSIGGQSAVSGTPTSTTSPAPARESVAVRPGTYQLGESLSPNAPTGLTLSQYAASYACTDGFGGTQSSPTVTLQLGQNVTCTVTNDDKPVALTLRKSVTNDNGGGALPAAWTLTANGPSSTSIGGTSPVVSTDLPAGTYQLAESAGPGGYAAQGWICTGGTVTPNPTDPSRASVAVVNGADVTCTVTNDDIAPTISLVKTVVNDHGGASVASDWTLTATPTPALGGQGPVSGTATGTALTGTALAATAVRVGTYSLSETAAGSLPQQYAESWSCTINGGAAVSGSAITLGLAQNAVCTATNDDKPVTLMLVKEVVNDNGGTALPVAWTLTATGAGTLSGATGVSSATLPAGTYQLGETGPAGYTAEGWDCTAGTVTQNPSDPSRASVALRNGDTVTCTVTNNDRASGLSVDKRAWTGAVTPAVGNGGAPSLSPAPGQTVTERAPGVSLPSGTALVFSYTVTNTGGVPLTGVVVTDNRKSGDVCSVPGTLAVGASYTCYWGSPLARIP